MTEKQRFTSKITKKYSLNENNEWSFKQIHQIISELENMRIQQPFRVDGFHFKKDIFERI